MKLNENNICLRKYIFPIYVSIELKTNLFI